MTQTVFIRGQYQRDLVKRLIDIAPIGAVIKIKPESRTLDQNAKLWAMLSDISRSKPNGKKHTPEVWKALLMSACGYACQFEEGLDGTPFPVGFASSKLTKKQMSDLIEFAYSYGAQNGVKWSDNYE